jgi:hypothetical protein
MMRPSLTPKTGAYECSPKLTVDRGKSVSHCKEAISVFQHDEMEPVPQEGSGLPSGGAVVEVELAIAVRCQWLCSSRATFKLPMAQAPLINLNVR